MFKRIFKKLFTKKEKVTENEYTLEEAMKLRDDLYEKSKNIYNELASSNKFRLTESVYEAAKLKVQQYVDLQKDIASVKNAISVANVVHNNTQNIYDREEAKNVRDLLYDFSKYRKISHPTFFQKIGAARTIKEMKKKMDALSNKMQEINEGARITIKLVSGLA